MLVAGHGGMVALCRGAPAVTGHGKARREAHGLRGDHMNPPRLPRLGGKCDGVCPHAWLCGSESAAALAIVFNAGEAMVHRRVTP